MPNPRINKIYAPAWKLRENAHIERTIGAAEICARCKATLATYGDTCSAPLDERCPGFEAIERATATAPADCRPAPGEKPFPVGGPS